ncbi:UDP-N-acetylmuramoylalanyl-D-glutamyl-2,6-diaminopimelate--D-alanyl-D-alanine ligase [Fodinicurvata sp. EGI_FJ10296]|uniref:UDP-N-acetylmuramoylalanyl-D-glutamyl-2, 6-diaminopimelate--D-alanyl-D-alanine ligase n=1 Tax=Fodinicurvata sp. EGI_FJ10296 TaxID=3231908 RepID=UPI00345472D6
MTRSDLPLWTSEEAAAATDGALPVGSGARWTAHGVSIDSRAVKPGDLFVALAGEQTDGHRFVDAALKAGAAAAVVSRPIPGAGPDAPLLSVADTTEALVALGSFARLRSTARIAAITGSVGKTGTKEALRQVLADQAPTTATIGNLNNHFGVPLSLARLPSASRFGVFEVGMNHAGEIAPLSAQIKPHLALISSVDAVHLEHFASVEGIADAKAEIFTGMGPSGAAVLPRDNPHFPRLLAHARTQGLTRVLSFGADPASDARLISYTLGADGSDVEAEILGNPVRYTLPVPGYHWVVNTLGVLLAAQVMGASLERAVESLKSLSVPAGRGRRETLALAADTPGGGADTFDLIDESYNASPVAVAAALKVLGAQTPKPGARRIAILGDMLELGPSSADLHRDLAPAAIDAAVDLVFTAGPMAAHISEALPEPMRGGHAKDSASLAPIVAAAIRPGDIVMVKGSLGARMATIVQALRALGTDANTGSGLRSHSGGR